MKITVEAWRPEFASPLPSSERSPSDALVDPGVELPPDRWKPIRNRAPANDLVSFVDGVRRVDALVWFSPDRGAPTMGLCASYATGVVHAGRATGASSQQPVQAVQPVQPVKPVGGVLDYRPTTTR